MKLMQNFCDINNFKRQKNGITIKNCHLPFILANYIKKVKK